MTTRTYDIGEFDFQHCPNCHVKLFVEGVGSTIDAKTVSLGTLNEETGLYHRARSRYTCKVCHLAYVVTFEPGIPLASLPPEPQP